MTKPSTSSRGEIEVPEPTGNAPPQIDASRDAVAAGRAANRIISAFMQLETAFAVAGLSGPPVAVIVGTGDRMQIEALISRHPQLLLADTTGRDTSIWGIRIMEADDHA